MVVNTVAQLEPAITPPARPVTSPVDTLSVLLADELRGVEELIVKHMHSPVGLIPDVAGYLVEAGGKRMRPTLTLAASRACGAATKASLALATAVEFIHTATLLHDDVVDGSTMRRGQTAANIVWNNKTSVLVGDFLFARSFTLMVEAGDLDVLGVLAHASSVIAEGEVMQLAAAARGGATRTEYEAIIDAKTAALFAAAAKVGAMTAGATPARVQALWDYGRHLGLAFQLVDDALDYGGEMDSLGKNVGDDFREGKATLPLIIAMERGSPEEKDFWRKVLSSTEKTDADFTEGLALIRKHGALEATFDAARYHVAEAHKALAHLEPTPFSRALGDLVDYTIVRVT